MKAPMSSCREGFKTELMLQYNNVSHVRIFKSESVIWHLTLGGGARFNVEMYIIFQILYSL